MAQFQFFQQQLRHGAVVADSAQQIHSSLVRRWLAVSIRLEAFIEYRFVGSGQG
ncbi:hypothetical protein D3C71_2197530 [compost metagenome]